MRTTTFFAVATLLCSAVGTAETYRWVDRNGVVHYSDRPAPGAEVVQLPKAAPPGSVAPPAAAAPPSVSGTVQARPFEYASCAITTPMRDQTFPNTNSVGASVALEPGLRLGDRIEVQLDGVTVPGWPPTSTSFILSNLFRGSHSLLAVIRDSSGRALCSSPAVSFHVTQPSLLSPAR